MQTQFYTKNQMELKGIPSGCGCGSLENTLYCPGNSDWLEYILVVPACLVGVIILYGRPMLLCMRHGCCGDAKMDGVACCIPESQDTV
jgi:hypothetical protein